MGNREYAWEQAEGHCGWCGLPMLKAQAHLHHRRRRSQSSNAELNRRENLVWVHGKCHVLSSYSIHQNPQWAMERGFLVPVWADPKDVPLDLNPRKRVT